MCLVGGFTRVCPVMRWPARRPLRGVTGYDECPVPDRRARRDVRLCPPLRVHFRVTGARTRALLRLLALIRLSRQSDRGVTTMSTQHEVITAAMPLCLVVSNGPALPLVADLS